MIKKRLWQLWYVQARWLTAFPFYLNIPMAYQCYVINVKLSMLRSTAQHGSASNVILILYFSVFKTEEAWFNLGLSIKRYLRKHHCISKIWAFHLWVIDCYKNLIETKVFNSVRGKCTVFSFCMVDSRLHWMFETLAPFSTYRWGATAQSWEKKTLDVIDVIFVHLIYFPSFSLPTCSPLFLSTLLPLFICNQSLF